MSINLISGSEALAQYVRLKSNLREHRDSGNVREYVDAMLDLAMLALQLKLVTMLHVSGEARRLAESCLDPAMTMLTESVLEMPLPDGPDMAYGLQVLDVIRQVGHVVADGVVVLSTSGSILSPEELIVRILEGQPLHEQPKAPLN